MLYKQMAAHSDPSPGGLSSPRVLSSVQKPEVRGVRQTPSKHLSISKIQRGNSQVAVGALTPAKAGCMGLNTACNTCRAVLHQMHLALLGAASGAKKVTRAAILLHHPLFSFLLNSICGCSCKLASFWLLWGELEGCSGGSWDYDCIVHRDKP